MATFKIPIRYTPKLTLDIGLRYDYYEAVKMRYPGGASNYDPYNNTLLIAGYGNIGLSDGVNAQPGYWAPRLGIAYGLDSPGGQWVSPSALALPAVGTLGNAGRDILRGPGFSEYDANVVRKFRFKERATLETRLEATNVTNTPHLEIRRAASIRRASAKSRPRAANGRPRWQCA
jgi:hypothetical protein